MVTRVSKKGSDPCCVGSTVNWMWGSWLLMCWSRPWLCSALLMTKVSSTNLSHREGVGEGLEGFDFKLFHEDVSYEGADGGSHSCTLYLFIILTLEEELGCGVRQNSSREMIWEMDMEVSDLMKQPQYGSQQKLVMILIMVLLCLQQF